MALDLLLTILEVVPVAFFNKNLRSRVRFWLETIFVIPIKQPKFVNIYKLLAYLFGYAVYAAIIRGSRAPPDIFPRRIFNLA